MNFLKNILKNTLSGILSFFLGIFFIIIFFSVLTALFSDNKDEKILVKEKSILHIDNLSIIDDRDLKASDVNLDIEIPIPLLQSQKIGEKISLRTFERIIDYAKDDKKIEAIYLNFNAISISFNKLEKVRSILKNFKEVKPIYSYSEYYSKGAYYLSSIANYIAVSPPGFISVSGYGISEFFYKDFFSELGIKIQLFRVGEYKGAAESYVRSNFSDENKEQYLSLLNYRLENYLNNISESRNISKDDLLNMINDYKSELSHDALKNNLVDDLLYEDEMIAYLKEKVDSSYQNISLLDYNKSLEKTNKYNKNKLAVLYAIGNILDGKGDEGIYSETIIKEIKKIKKNKNIKSVILYVNSGGGSALASDLITRELELLQKEKPLTVYMSDVCASGGYYISMPADTLIASEGSIVGSIGVFGILPELSGLMNEKLKISIDHIKTNNNTGEIDLFRPLNNDERNLIQRGINQVYSDFLNVVSKGRKMETEAVNKLARGKVYYGNEGKKINLIDLTGDFNDAVEIAAKLGNLDKYQIIEYPRQKTEFEKIISSLTEVKFLFNPIIKETNNNWLIKSLVNDKKFDPIQMRLEINID
jgi:protease IV